MSVHVYWSLNISAVKTASNNVIVYELEMRSTVGGSNMCTGGTATATSYTGSQTPSLAFNGNDADYWESGDAGAFPQRLIYQFSAAVDIYNYTLIVDSFTDTNPYTWTLEYSDDGTTWTVADTQTDYIFAVNTSTFNIQPVSLTAVDSTTTASSDIANAYRILTLTPVDIASTASSSTATAATLQTLTAVNITSTASSSTDNVSVNRLLSVIDSVAITSASTENIAATRNLVAVDSATMASSSTGNVSLTVFLVPVDSVATHENVSTYAVYLAINYHLDNKAVTTYSNFNFTGSCRFAGKTLFINGNGLFEYGGLTDNSAAIAPSLKTGKMCEIMGRMGLERSNKMKRIPASRISVSCDKTGGSIDLNVTEDNNAAIAYNDAITHDGYATYDIPIGRGTKFNFLQIELAANACTSLDIESIEFNPIELRRRER